MNIKLILTFLAIVFVISVDGKKTGRSRSSGSGRGSNRKTAPQPAPTSFSYPQPSAPKPSLSGWQERPAQKPSNSHSYPSSGTGLSGDKPKQTHTNQDSVQRSNVPQNYAAQPGHASNQQSHSDPSSTGLSGSPGSGYPQQGANKYPQQQNAGASANAGSSHSYPQSPGLSGNSQSGNSYPQTHGSSLSGSGQTGSNYPPQHGSGLSGNGQAQSGYSQSNPGNGNAQNIGGGYPQAPPPYSGYRPGDTNRPYNSQNNYGNNYHHPQGPPPPYTNVGNYGGVGGYGSHNPGYGSQMPGYFGNYGNNNGKGFGGVSRTGSALTGVGIAGAGIGTVLTGLALWNLARSSGRSQHTVIYDNRGQPVAVAPGNDTSPVADSILADLINCSLTISNDNKTEVLAIPCAIATSFSPEADVKESGILENKNDTTKCTISLFTKTNKEYMTVIPCSILLNTAAENNVTEPPIVSEEPGVGNNTSEVDHLQGLQVNGTAMNNTNTSPLSEPTALKLTGGEINLNCTLESGDVRDPINPCYSVNHNLTVIPLTTTDVHN